VSANTIIAEHVFEGQIISAYANYVDTKDLPGVGDCGPGGYVMTYLARTTELRNGSIRPSSFRGGSALQELALGLSNRATPGEMFGLDTALNNLKSKLFTTTVQQFTVGTRIEDKLLKLSQFGALYEYMSNASVIASYKATRGRILATLANLDRQVEAGNLVPRPPADEVDGYFGGSFLEFEIGALFDGIKAKAQGGIQLLINEVNLQITRNATLSQMEKTAYLAQVQRLTGPNGRARPGLWDAIYRAYSYP